MMGDTLRRTVQDQHGAVAYRRRQCGRGWLRYADAERVARKRGAANTHGVMVWRCYRCPMFHVGNFALERAA